MKIPPNMARSLRKALMQPAYALKIGMKRLEAGMYYRFGNGMAPAPEAITLFLTHRCNLRCRMCGQWGESGVTKDMPAGHVQEELPIDMLRSMVDDMAPYNSAFTLFGGEPLLYKDCISLIKHIKSKRLHCIMITNGSLIGDNAADLVSSGLDELNVSIDGKGEVHDRIRGLPGIFETIMTGLDALKKAKLSARSKKPIVNIQCTISSGNYTRLEDIADVAYGAGADSITFHNLIFTDKDILSRQRKIDQALGSSSERWKGFDFDPGVEPGVLWEKISRILIGTHPFNVDMYPNFSRAELERYYKDPMFVPSEYRARCLSPWIAAYIFPDGEVRPCLNSTYSYGNIKTEPLPKVWNSQKAVVYRRALKDNKIFPVCVRCTELYRY